jgi:hypothetical protein
LFVPFSPKLNKEQVRKRGLPPLFIVSIAGT